MSDGEDKPRRPTLEELRARAAGKPLPTDPAYQRDETKPAGPRVVSIFTRDEYVPPPAPPDPDEPLRPNERLVEIVEELLRMVRAGEITAMSSVVYNAERCGFEILAVMPTDRRELLEEHALRHIGALELLRGELLGIVVNPELIDDPEEPDDEEGHSEE